MDWFLSASQSVYIALIFYKFYIRVRSHRRIRARGAGEWGGVAASPESGKAIIFRENAKVFGQKPAARHYSYSRVGGLKSL